MDDEQKKQRSDYRRGWNSASKMIDGQLDDADSRGEMKAWYDGYYDQSCDRPMYHGLTCVSCDDWNH